MSDTASSPASSHCNRCLGVRNHDVLHAEHRPWEQYVDDDESHSIFGADTYEMLRCRGCGSISLRHRSWFSEVTDRRGDPIETVRYYPPLISRQKPDWLFVLSLEDDYEYSAEILEEVYVALQSGLTRLATMGIRALLENLMIAKVGDRGSFARNLAAFEAEGFISRVQKETLATTLEAGHAVMHRTHKLSPAEVVSLVDIAEGLIEAIYVHPGEAVTLRERIPPRQRHDPAPSNSPGDREA